MKCIKTACAAVYQSVVTRGGFSNRYQLIYMDYEFDDATSDEEEKKEGDETDGELLDDEDGENEPKDE